LTKDEARRMAALWKMTPISIESPAMSAEGLQVELIGGLRRHELHRWTLHSLGHQPPHRGSRSSVPSNRAARTSPASAEHRDQAP
jgi:hypothetical protein